MKRVFCLLLFFPLAFAYAQQPVFLRVYNTNGQKINKGYLLYLSDTSITLTRKRTVVTETPVSQIGLIKSKRTTGHRIIVTTAAVVSVAAFVVVLIWTNKDRTTSGFFNTGRGRKEKQGIKPLASPKPFKKYKVDGNTETWQQQKAQLALLH